MLIIKIIATAELKKSVRVSQGGQKVFLEFGCRQFHADFKRQKTKAGVIKAVERDT